MIPTTTANDFTPYIRTVGRGPNLSRSLTRAESKEAFRIIFDGNAEPLQLGGLLIALRNRGETPEEIAGMIDASRERITVPGADGLIELDWPTYADRHRQQPWFILSAKLLAANGVRVLMHGIKGYDDGYAPSRPVLQQLNIEISPSLDDACRTLEKSGIAYAGIENFCPAAHDLFGLSPALGVRTAVNTFARAINPLSAPAQILGVAHPPYMELHAETGRLMGQQRSVTIKGGGGEAQRNPFKKCRAITLTGDSITEKIWPQMDVPDRYDWRDENLDAALPAKVWNGEIPMAAPEAAVIATTALALDTLGRTDTMNEAAEMAQAWWHNRDRTV